MIRPQDKNALWFLGQALKLIKEARELYTHYSNTGNKDTWDALIVPMSFHICYCQIIDFNLLAKENLALNKFIKDYHRDLDGIWDYTLDQNKRNTEKVLSVLHLFYKDTFSMFNKYAKGKIKDASLFDFLNTLDQNK